MNDIGRSEYDALRATIRERGSVRVITFLATLFAWAALLLTEIVTAVGHPLVLLLPLLVLAGGFEAVFQIHIGVERVGRYLQVAYEERLGAPGGDGGPAGPGWETVAMSYGRAYPSAGSDALFSRVFLLGDLVNLLWLIVAAGPPSSVPWLAVLAAHLGFALRVVAAGRRAARQRGEDLERFRALLETSPPADHSSGAGSRLSP